MPSFGPISSAPVSSEGAGSASVYADFTAAFAIANLVGATFGGYYSIAGGTSSSVSADFSGAYAIASLVGATFAGGFAITQLARADFPGMYAVLGNTSYTRAPDGAGYTPRYSCGPVRPANIQGSTR